ncbi:hypothetical protein [Speluncibacter jeojiensis]|uniref:Transmembrane protein n=1 Tax=Speluncibacter jeojiensis TaxID=2710754 RepID=A0A9X4RF80_9ACTN|nr:hypothetical protein [Corynebacteriales bacterium D3-21]
MSSQADDGQDARPVTVAELLARNGSQPGSRAHRRRTRKGGISVAELTGEIPVIRDEPGDEYAEHGQDAEPAQSEDHGTADEDTARDDGTAGDHAATTTEAEDDAAAADVVTDADPADADPVDVGAPGPVDPGTKAFTPPWAARRQAAAAQPAVGLLTTDSAAAELMRARYEGGDYADPEYDDARYDDLDHEAGHGHDDHAARVGVDASAGDLEVTEDPADGTSQPSSRGALKQWAVITLQCVVAIVAGALLFKGFEKLWDVLPWVALVLAVLVVLGLVALVRILRKTDDIMSILIAVIAGLIVTLGPLAFLLSTR